MCNEVARRIALGQLREDWAELKVPLVFPEGLPNLAPLDSIRITDPTLILRAAPDGGGAEAVTRRWSWPGAHNKPVYNVRSEGRAFTGGDAAGAPHSAVSHRAAGRCLIPIDAFFEYTDVVLHPRAEGDGGLSLEPSQPSAPSPRARGKPAKDKWRFTHPTGAWFCVAGWWRAEPTLGEGGEAFAMLTCDPGPDIAPYHPRQIVLPPRHQWPGWLDGSIAAPEVCRPSPANTLAVAIVRRSVPTARN